MSVARKLTTWSSWRRNTHRQQFLGIQLTLEPWQIIKSNPVDAVHRTGLDRFLDAIRGISILTNCPGAPEMRLNHKGVRGHMRAVTATNTGRFINPHRLGLKPAAQDRLQSCPLVLIKRRCDIGDSRWILHRINLLDKRPGSGVPTGHHQLDRSILAITLLCDIKSFMTRGFQH